MDARQIEVGTGAMSSLLGRPFSLWSTWEEQELQK
jgi:hypothetical protein